MTENVKATDGTISDEFPVRIGSEELSLCWDPPKTNPDSVSSYEIYYHCQKSSNWVVLKQNIEASITPNVTITRHEIDTTDSIFYFAVRSVMKNGTKSDFHYSLDSTAIPPSWCLWWQ